MILPKTRISLRHRYKLVTHEIFSSFFSLYLVRIIFAGRLLSRREGICLWVILQSNGKTFDFGHQSVSISVFGQLHSQGGEQGFANKRKRVYHNSLYEPPALLYRFSLDIIWKKRIVLGIILQIDWYKNRRIPILIWSKKNKLKTNFCWLNYQS